MDIERLLSDAFLEAHPGDAALLLEALAPAEAAALLEGSPTEGAAAVLQRMAPLSGADCLAAFAAGAAGPVLRILPLDLAAGLLRRIEPEARARLLASAPADVSGQLELLLRYPEQAAGALMDPRVLALPDDVDVGEAQARVRRAPEHVLYYLYVVDRAHALVGVLNLRELMLAPVGSPLAAVMRPRVARISALAVRSAIVAHPGWRQFHALPVVDEGGAFLGALRYETLRRLEEDTATQPPAPGPLPALLTLAELCWVGLAGVLAEIAPGPPPPRPAGPDPREANHAR